MNCRLQPRDAASKPRTDTNHATWMEHAVEVLLYDLGQIMQVRIAKNLLHPLPAGNIRHREVPHGSRHHQTCAKAFITEMKSQRQTTKAQEIESYTTTTKLKLQHSPMILTSGGCKLFRKHLNAGKLLHGLLRSASCQHCHFGIDLTCEALGLRPSRSPILGVWANGH